MFAPDPSVSPNPTGSQPYQVAGLPPIALYEFDVFSVTLTNPRPDTPGSFPLVDLLSGDPLPVTVSAGTNDLRMWFDAPLPVNLQISSSRWDHVLRLCHPNGESYPIARDQIAGFLSVEPNGTTFQQTYYYFTATSKARPDLPWHLEDLSTDPVQRIGPTGDRLGPTRDELIVWYDVPTPKGLTGVLSVGLRKVELVWAPAGASLEGGFEIERSTTGAAGWMSLYALAAGDGMMRDGLFHFDNADLTVGQVHSYRVRYLYGGESSGYSNEISLNGWQDGDLDGLPDAWEMANFGTLGYDGDGPNGDPDGDGISNLDEFNEHRNPNALSANAPGSTLIVYTPLQ